MNMKFCILESQLNREPSTASLCAPSLRKSDSESVSRKTAKASGSKPKGSAPLKTGNGSKYRERPERQCVKEPLKGSIPLALFLLPKKPSESEKMK